MRKAQLRSALLLAATLIIFSAHGQEPEESTLKKTKPPIINSGLTDPTPPKTPNTDETPPAQPDPQSEELGFTPKLEAEMQKAYAEISGDQPTQDSQNDNRLGTGALLRGYKVLAILLFLCSVIILLGYAVRRFGKRTPFLAGPDLGSVLGKVYLGPRASLHYVRSGSRILVLGVTQNNVQLITEFDESNFATAADQSVRASAHPTAPASFLQELQSRVEGTEKGRSSLQEPDDSIASLRGELQRLQQHLGKSLREPDA